MDPCLILLTYLTINILFYSSSSKYFLIAVDDYIPEEKQYLQFKDVFFNFENEPILTSKMHPPLPIVPKN